MWLAVHRIPGFGPWVADTLRSLFGNEFVAWLEDTAYGVEDWVNRKTKAEKPPEAPWDVPPDGSASLPAPPASAASASEAPPFTLAKVGPMHAVSTEGEGAWVPLVDPRNTADRVRMLKTYLHPDKQRSWAVAIVVAVDLTHVELHVMAGRFEPESMTKEAKDYVRKAVVPEAHRTSLLAAFNGGYKATHGDYGMRIDGVTLVPPRALACVVAKMKDGRILVRNWDDAKDEQEQMVWLRQTPICMYDLGKPHPGLSMPSMSWGASSVSGTTVIRRSAIGLSDDGKVLYVGIGDFLTGESIGRAMHHAGAHSVAQLDVNFSFPKFLLYQTSEGEAGLRAVPLTKNFEYDEDQYVGTRSHRDFFYLVRRTP